MYWLESVVAVIGGTAGLMLFVMVEALDEGLRFEVSWLRIVMLAATVVPSCLVLIIIEEWLGISPVYGVPTPVEESVTDAIVIGLVVGLLWDSILLKFSTPLDLLSIVIPDRFHGNRVLDIYLKFLRRLDKEHERRCRRGWSSVVDGDLGFAFFVAKHYAGMQGEVRKEELKEKLPVFRDEARSEGRVGTGRAADIDLRQVSSFFRKLAAELSYRERVEFEHELQEQSHLRGKARSSVGGKYGDKDEVVEYQEARSDRKPVERRRQDVAERIVVVSSGEPSGRFQIEFKGSKRVPETMLTEGFGRVIRACEIGDCVVYVDDSVTGASPSGPLEYDEPATQRAFLQRLRSKLSKDVELVILGLEPPNLRLMPVPSGWSEQTIESVRQGVEWLKEQVPV